jgi:hypothetical protein
MTRPISAAEAMVLENALQVGPLGTLSPEAVSAIRGLCVTASCKCGCATVWFGPKGDATLGIKVAEACGTWSGGSVDIIVWSADGQIVGLELVGAGPVGLPDPASVRPLEQWFQAS